MTIAEKILRAKEDYDVVYGASKAKAEAITRGLIDRSITEIVIPDGVKKIGAHLFAYHYVLKKVTIPESVERLDGNAFSWTALTELDLPIGCKFLNDYALYACNETGLKRIRLGDTVEIKGYVFTYNRNCLLYDFSRNTAVPILTNTNSFNGINANAKILVPAALYYDWITATNWSEYADYIVPDGLLPSKGLEYSFNGWNYEVIGRGSCLDSVIVIPETYNDGINGEHAVNRINGDNDNYVGAFANDQTIEEIVLPEGFCSLAWNAFEGSSLKVVRNYSGGDSFWSSGLTLEYVSFIDGTGILNFDFSAADYVKTLDFSRHTSVPLLSDATYLNAHPDLQILVPIELYDEWVVATNWVEFAEYLVAVE